MFPVLFGNFAYIDPFSGGGVFFKFRNREFNGAVAASGGRIHIFEAFHGCIQINLDAVIDAEGAYAADGMANAGGDFIGSQHFRFGTEESLIFLIVYFGIPGGDD